MSESVELSVVIYLIQIGLHHDSVLSPLLFIIKLESLSREVKSGCPEKLSYPDNLKLVGETLYSLKGRREARKGTLGLKRLSVNVK